MGLDYAFEMWVPREQLFEALSVVAKYAFENDFASLIWPDGRRLSVERPSNDARDLIPVDSSLKNEGLCLSFAIEADEVLRRYNEVNIGYARRNGLKIRDWDMRQPDGTIGVSCPWTSIQLDAQGLDWLDEEPLLTRLSFTAATTSVSQLFEDSPAVKSYFVALAREMGAISCELNKEYGDVEWLYLDGQELQLNHNSTAHPRRLRYFLGAQPSPSERKLLSCNLWGQEACSAHQLLEVQLLTRDEDSGVRAAALRWLIAHKREQFSPLVVAATADSDWRARANAAYLIGRYEIESLVSQLEAMLHDVDPEVRIAAVQALGCFDSTFEMLREVLLQTPMTTENSGLIKAAMREIAKTTYQPHVATTLQAALARPNFPFPHGAQELIGRFQR